MTVAVALDGVGKRYWKLQERAMLLRSLIPFAGPTKTEMWALRELSTTVEQGETLGILGRNGAGKTTLLRLLAGVSQPTEGRVHIRGRIAPLISVGVGFHHEMSGRENVYVNGMLLGLTKAQVAQRFDTIVAFAELEDFIDTPVKFYSSGMFMRLGFSVAAHVDPDVLLVDEVLAVGDVAFQLKCFERMRKLQEDGTTILLVSHSMHAIRLLCPRALLIRRGRLEFDGATEDAIARHHELLSIDAADDEEGGAAGAATISDRELIGPDGPTSHPYQEDALTYRAVIRFNGPVESPQVVFHLVSDSGILAYSMQTTIGQSWRRFEGGDTVQVEVPFQPRLGGGTYRVALVVMDRDGRRVIANDSSGLMMYLAPRLGAAGIADLEARILLDDEDLTQHKSLTLPSARVSGGKRRKLS